MEILRCEHLSKIYGEGNNCVKALDDVSFQVEKGEFVSIVGSSGSGKSTLLHILGGVDKPSSGEVYIGDTNIHTLPRISWLFSDAGRLMRRFFGELLPESRRIRM